MLCRRSKKGEISRREKETKEKEPPERPAMYLQAIGPGIRRYSCSVI
jgi:hypothetical protein